jgi:Na+/proline symporter
MVVTALVALVGVGLYAWYQAHPLEGRALELVTEKPDRIFPVFVVTEVPAGLRGLILAGAFAAAISSLDSILAALSQTTLSAWIAPWRERVGRPLDDRGALSASRVLVVAYGLGLAALAVGCEALERKYPSILDRALALAGYTPGALLAGFLLAFLPLRVDGRGFVIAAPLSLLAVFAVAWSSTEVWHELANPRAGWSAWVVLAGLAALSVAWVRGATTSHPHASGGAVGAHGSPVLRAPLRHASFVLALAAVLLLHASNLRVAWPWYAPVGCAFALGFGYLWAHRSDRPPPSKETA